MRLRFLEMVTVLGLALTVKRGRGSAGKRRARRSSTPPPRLRFLEHRARVL